jgi:hypothetical protein
MQQTSTPTPAPTSPSFAGLLAALASPEPKPQTPWSDDDLADDVATLSYENALRAHARYRATSPPPLGARFASDQSLTQPLPQNDEPEPIRRIQGPLGDELMPPPPAVESRPPAFASARVPNTQPAPDPNPFQAAQIERNLKDASITIRMSHAESEQLRRRAAEAGLTISAYLRSCTFEVESLRAMVKDTVAQLRTAQAMEKPPEVKPARHTLLRTFAGWFSHLLTPWNSTQRMARV